MQKRKSRYTDEFKSEAVKLAASLKGERSVRQVARELGISNRAARDSQKVTHWRMLGPGFGTDRRVDESRTTP